MVQPWPDQPSWLCVTSVTDGELVRTFRMTLAAVVWYMFTPTSCMAAGSKSKMARLFVWFTHSKIFLPNFLQSGNARVECQFQTGSYSVMYFQPESSCTHSVTTPYTNVSVTSVTEGELMWTSHMSSVASILVHVHPPPPLHISQQTRSHVHMYHRHLNYGSRGYLVWCKKFTFRTKFWKGRYCNHL